MKYIDLRSDTVTKPSDAMRKAMANAEVGDDVFGDDPTVNRLQDMIAERLGKESALFVPSGSMGNAICLRVQTSPGDEIIIERYGHIVNYEVANVAVFSGLQTSMVDGINGVISREQVEPLLKDESLHSPGTKLICIENTHNRAGGMVFPLQEIKKLRELADDRGIGMHLDGARLWNAHISTNIPLQDFARLADSVSVCFSKGLGAPIGSCVAGTQAFIDKARRIRKMLGGGMRQVGVLAAAAIYAVENNIKRLADDHANARYIAEELAKVEGISIDLDTVHTNIVIFDVDATGMTASEITDKWKAKGVLTLPISARRIRLVTHLDVSSDDCRKAMELLREAVAA
ncbi:MAG: GntG family PLP-dependent aldolase [Candidatus Zixiibacteriota bacterium]